MLPQTCFVDEVASISHQSKPGLTLKVADWNSWTYTDGSCHIQEGKQAIGTGVYHPSTGNSSLVEPNGAGLNNTIGRAELAAIAAALTHDHTHIATDSLTSLHQIRKQMLYPEKHRHHVQFSLIPSVTLNPTSSFIRSNLTLGLQQMNVQTPLPNTKPATAVVSQLRQQSASQALVAIPSLIQPG
jgi:hypothetical protein